MFYVEVKERHNDDEGTVKVKVDILLDIEGYRKDYEKPGMVNGTNMSFTEYGNNTALIVTKCNTGRAVARASFRLKRFDHACDPTAAGERQGLRTRQEQQRDLWQKRKILVGGCSQSLRREPIDHRGDAEAGRSGGCEHGEI